MALRRSEIIQTCAGQLSARMAVNTCRVVNRAWIEAVQVLHAPSGIEVIDGDMDNIAGTWIYLRKTQPTFVCIGIMRLTNLTIVTLLSKYAVSASAFIASTVLEVVEKTHAHLEPNT